LIKNKEDSKGPAFVWLDAPHHANYIIAPPTGRRNGRHGWFFQPDGRPQIKWLGRASSYGTSSNMRLKDQVHVPFEHMEELEDNRDWTSW